MKKVLFIGDSITDGNRNKTEEHMEDLNHQIGHSYAYVINAILGSKYPEKGLCFFNRGVSGNRVIDIYARLDTDALDLQPDIVSILVGVNDGPQKGHSYKATEPKKFDHIYREMLDEIIEQLPNAKLVICEPFILEAGDLKEEYHQWENYIDKYRVIAKSIAEDYEAIFVPLQEEFNRACTMQNPEYWIWDGIHPTENGHGLIARQWISCTADLFEP